MSMLAEQQTFFDSPDQFKQNIPTFQEVLRQSRDTPMISKSTERYLDDLDMQVHEESLSSFLCMKTGIVYLGSMGVFGSYQVFRSIVSRELSFRQVAGSLAANVPKRVNGVASIVFCATATYAATSLIRGHQDNWNLLPCGAFIGGWSMHRFVSNVGTITPKTPAVILGSFLGGLVLLPYICYTERYTAAYFKHRIFRAFQW